METWTILRCPVANEFLGILQDSIAHKPEPWLSHGNLCLGSHVITPTKTLIVACLNQSGKIIGFTWLSLPDRQIINGWKSYAYIFHVYVEPAYRRLGYGKKAVSMACDFARANQVDGVVLATGDSGLRDKFYPYQGFRPIGSDPWLMKKVFRYQNKDDILQTHPLFRGVSQHDLGTVQSICCQPHWTIESGALKKCAAVEVEEEFCDLVICGAEQYLIKGAFQNKPYTCWIKKDASSLIKQRIVFSGKLSELEIVSSVIAELAEKIKAIPNSQIQKKIDLANSLIIK